MRLERELEVQRQEGRREPKLAPNEGRHEQHFVNSVGVAAPCSNTLGPRARLVGAHSTVEEGSGKRSMQIGKTLKLHPNIDLVVAEMGLFRRGLLSMYSHHDSFRVSQSLAQQKDSLHRIIYTEGRDCDQISNDPVMLKFSLLTLGCFAPLFHRSHAARDKNTLVFVLQLLRWISYLDV